ncbi:hypothetical protein L211DRAFT_840355 [Terfezia boudieri ATCC MYA-4762]|uniref:Uncharacterized protein n=1 Tax=Terfezia boudieri ATCC MYA-4762 TaxID=1051890 RepID=A0A3N4LFR6_9PEZI|nr:hypothetical protein L211DRAFT_840355 [Terfezia boudieri ATCC MYA-4762]
MDFSTEHSFFKVPLYHWRALESRPNPNRKTAKRKRDDESDESDESDENAQGSESGAEGWGSEPGRKSEPVTDRPSSSPVTQVTDATSSLSLGETDPELPPKRPTNPRILTRDHRLQHNVQALAKHNLFLPPRKPPALRTRHEAILNTILHKSILTRDWARAKRAFGLIIRGDWVDIRKIWMIGSDLLLRSMEQHEGKDSQDRYLKQQYEFQKRKTEMQNIEYLRRLILQFPYLGLRLGQTLPKGSDVEFTAFAAEKAEPEQVKRQKQKDMGKMHYANAIQFWPVLIAGLLGSSEYAAVEGEKGSNDNQNEGVRGFGDEGEQQEENGYYLSPSQDLFSPTHPQKIKEHLEEIMITPPWSDDVRLWCMRGMICLWLADLEIMTGTRDAWEDYDDGYDNTLDPLIHDNEVEDERWRRQQRRDLRAARKARYTRRETLLGEAKNALDTVEEKGGSLPEVLGYAMKGLTNMEEDE